MYLRRSEKLPRNFNFSTSLIFFSSNVFPKIKNVVKDISLWNWTSQLSCNERSVHSWREMLEGEEKIEVEGDWDYSLAYINSVTKLRG